MNGSQLTAADAEVVVTSEATRERAAAAVTARRPFLFIFILKGSAVRVPYETRVPWWVNSYASASHEQGRSPCKSMYKYNDLVTRAGTRRGIA